MPHDLYAASSVEAEGAPPVFDVVDQQGAGSWPAALRACLLLCFWSLCGVDVVVGLSVDNWTAVQQQLAGWQYLSANETLMLANAFGVLLTLLGANLVLVLRTVHKAAVLLWKSGNDFCDGAGGRQLRLLRLSVVLSGCAAEIACR